MDRHLPNLFLITGGGTGAKVAEALVHLCAAGLGPQRLHVLLIDSDTANGNLNRTVDTIRAYQEMQQWPWSIRAKVGYGGLSGMLKKAETEWLSLFGTEVRMHRITEAIRTVLDGGIETAVHSEEMHQVLDLLYDSEEQTAKCDDGFRARPNLGCLLMADHLKEMLPTRAPEFLREMKAAASVQEVVPVVVSASVFGGTGASLLPIVRGCIERALSVGPETLAKYRWASVKMLPHYRPAKRKESVDPDRYLLDTASALQFYSTVYETTEEKGRFEAMYLVGSDNPARNRVKAVLGFSGQANPGYFEEALAALAVLHFGGHAADSGSQPMRVYDPDMIAWDSLPADDRDALRQNLAYLLHLAAYFLRHGGQNSSEQKAMGMARFLRHIPDSDVQSYPWYGEILDRWAVQNQAYKAAEGHRRVAVLRNRANMGAQSIEAMYGAAAEYFGRLLLWSQRALRDEAFPLFDYRSDKHYAGLHGTMSDIKSQEVDVRESEGGEAQIPFEEDNALVRLLRAATSALIHHHKHNARGKSLNAPVVLFDEQDGSIRLNTSYQQTKDTLREAGLGRLVEEYTSTLVTATNGTSGDGAPR